MTKENHKFLKDNNISHTGKPLGRKPKEDLNRYQKGKLKKNEVNEITLKESLDMIKQNTNSIT